MVTKQFSRTTIGLAAEYAVAAELCRRGMYAQLTLGNQKRTDLLVFSETGKLARIEVKAKQGRDWPNCKGIFGRGVFLVFVDFQRHEAATRPEFFILTVKDWRKLLERRVREIKKRHPGKRIRITDENVAVFLDEIGKSGKPYRGIGIGAKDVGQSRERWGKIARALGAA